MFRKPRPGNRGGRRTLAPVTHFFTSNGLPLLFLVVMLESFGIPLPGETALIGAALYAGSAHKLVGPYQAVHAADRHFVLGATTPNTWRSFCAALGLERLEHDPRFRDGTLRRHNADVLIQLIEEVTATRPAAHWLDVLRGAGVPCADIADYAAVFEDVHLRERGFFVDLAHPTLGSVRALGTPLRLRALRDRPRGAGPPPPVVPAHALGAPPAQGAMAVVENRQFSHRRSLQRGTMRGFGVEIL